MQEPSRATPSPAGLVLPALLGAFLVGCSSFDGGSDVLGTAALNPADGPAPVPGADWSCLDSARTTALPVLPGQGRVVYSVQALDFTTRQAATPGVIMGRACLLTDVECSEPASPWLPTDERGWIDFTLFQGFVGYLEFKGEGVMPALGYIGEPLNESTTLNYPLFYVTVDSLIALANILGITLNPQLGLLALRAFDCGGVTAPDVVFSKIGAGERWYFADGLPSVTAAATGSDGYGGFANVPPGVASIDVQAPNGDSISGVRSAVVRPGSFTALYVWPPGTRIAPPAPPTQTTAAMR